MLSRIIIRIEKVTHKSTQTHPISGGDFTSLRRDAAQSSNEVTEGDFIKGPINEKKK